MAFVMVHIGDC